jgi:hypothetical protein
MRCGQGVCCLSHRLWRVTRPGECRGGGERQQGGAERQQQRGNECVSVDAQEEYRRTRRRRGRGRGRGVGMGDGARRGNEETGLCNQASCLALVRGPPKKRVPGEWPITGTLCLVLGPAGHCFCVWPPACGGDWMSSLRSAAWKWKRSCTAMPSLCVLAVHTHTGAFDALSRQLLAKSRDASLSPLAPAAQ